MMKTLILHVETHFTIDQQMAVTFTPAGMDQLRTSGGWDSLAPIRVFPFEPNRVVVDILDWNPSPDPDVQAAIELVKHGGVYDRAKCYGYFGFGTGFLAAAMHLAVPEQGLVVTPFCAVSCPLSADCKARHDQRMAALNIDSRTALWWNTEDGIKAGAGQPMPDRGEATLTWPLTVLPSNAVAH